MKNKNIKEKIAKLPDAPGVYKFLRGNNILYIGKATSLRDRVRSYFNSNITETRGPLISKMLSEADDVRFIKTDSVLEALVLEAKLIKQLQPEANVKEKDNKSFNYVVITKEDFPRVLIMRGREIEKLFKPSSRENPREERRRRTEENFSKNFPWFSRDAAQNNFSQEDGSGNFSISHFFGPFPNGSQLKEAMKIVRKMFPFRDKCNPLNSLIISTEKKGISFLPPSPSQGEGLGVRSRGCFNYQIGLCPGVCVGKISKEDYKKNIENIILFFESDKKKLIKNLEKQMKDFAKQKKFEEAGKIKKTIFTLNHIQDVSLIKDDVAKPVSGAFDVPEREVFRIESYDIAHLSGTNMVGVMTVLENGEIKKSDYRKFKIQGNKVADDTKALSEILTRRLAHTEWPLPNLIVVDGGIAQKNAIEKVLKQNSLSIRVVSVVKDERHKAKGILGIEKLKIKNLESQILLSNAEAHRFAINFHKKLRSKFIK